MNKIPIMGPMPGKAVSINVKVGDAVKTDDVILTYDVMKMHNEFLAAEDGIVKQVNVSESQAVKKRNILLFCRRARIGC